MGQFKHETSKHSDSLNLESTIRLRSAEVLSDDPKKVFKLVTIKRIVCNALGE